MFHWMRTWQSRWFAWLNGPPAVASEQPAVASEHSGPPSRAIQHQPDAFCEKISEHQPAVLHVQAWGSGDVREYLFSFRVNEVDRDSEAHCARFTYSLEEPIPAKFQALLGGHRVSNPAAILEKFAEDVEKHSLYWFGDGE